MQHVPVRARLSAAAVLTLALLAALPLVAAQAQTATGLATEDMSTRTAQELAQMLVGPGVSVSNATFSGAAVAGGTFTNDDANIVEFAQGVVLSSGRIDGVIGPNDGSGASTANEMPGDEQLTALAGPDATTFDAAVLTFDFVPDGDALTFEYVFSSEEYTEYVNSGVNDVFGFFVNGTNCATVGDGQPVSIDTINPQTNSSLYRDNEADPAPINTEMDGLTVTLSCTAAVSSGATNTMKLAIADAGDDIVDSNVFIGAGTLTSAPEDTGTIISSGPLTTVAVSSDLTCGVAHAGVPQFFNGDSCGTYVAVNGTLYGPAQPAAGAPPRTAFTPVAQTKSGAGTSTAPFVIETVVSVGETSLQLTQTDRYVVGQEQWETTLHLEELPAPSGATPSATTTQAFIYRVADCKVGGNDHGFGAANTTTGAVACLQATTAAQQTGGRVEWQPSSGTSTYLEGEYLSVYGAVDGDGFPTPSSCECGTYLDNGAGLSWPVNVGPDAPATVAHHTLVAPRAAMGGGGGGGGVSEPTPTPTPTATPTPTPTEPEEPGGPEALPEGGFDDDPLTTGRVDETTPEEAALQLSKARFDDASDAVARAVPQAAVRLADYVVLSRIDVFADSLAGTPLTRNGPLLFTGRDDVPNDVLREMDRVLSAGGKVYLLGGTAAIDGQAEQELRDAGFDVQRLAGASRVETALAVADLVRELFPGGNRVALARASSPRDNPTAAWADSITGGAWAASEGVPVLLTATDALHPAVASWLARNDDGETVLLGGTAALSAAVEDAVPNPRRVAGATRAETAVAVARDLWGVRDSGLRRFVIVNGYRDDGWAFGLPAGGISADARAAMLLVGNGSIPAATARITTSCDSPSVDLLLVGSTHVIPGKLRQALDALDGTPC